jgi:mannose-6-phosphate isomerase
LSVNKPLSIQVHPNKKQAKSLHQNNPKLYSDPNHKPEMALALTRFELLCGFRPIFHIKNSINNVPELKRWFEIFLQTVGPMENQTTQSLFTIIMKASSFDIKSLITEMANRMSLQPLEELGTEDVLFLKLNQFYPNDVGTLCAYFMNYIVLEPKSAIFIDAGVPHAYISGDCVECMSCSDNVVRAGLTSKPKDIDTLLQIVDWDAFLPSTIQEYKSHPLVSFYKPPCKEFKQETLFCQKTEMAIFSASIDPSIFLVLEGSFEVQVYKENKYEYFLLGNGNSLLINHNVSCIVNGFGKLLRCSTNY